jgi:hypothetical protein
MIFLFGETISAYLKEIKKSLQSINYEVTAICLFFDSCNQAFIGPGIL